MGIPIIEDIFNGIKFVITFFMDKAPRPIKFMFFLLMLVGLVAMIPFMLHFFGFHCNTSSELIQLSPLKVTTNIRLAFIGADEYINTSSYVPENLNTFGFFSSDSCRKPVCYIDGEYYYQSMDECDNQTIVYPYLTTLVTWSRCSICDGNVTSTFIRGAIGNSDTFYLCHGDSYTINKSDRNWYQSLTCNEDDRCFPPNYYYYEYDTGTYDCLDLDVCGINNTEIISVTDDLLKEADGKLLNKITNKNDYRKTITLKCDKNFSPQITFFGIPVFDYRIWLLFSVLFVMFMFLNNIKRH